MVPLPRGTIDETGHRYGLLLVGDYVGREEVGGHAVWLCRCDCGARVTVRAAKLRSGRVVSCGCWRADPAVRQAARSKVSKRRRRQIAKMGAAARWEAPLT